MIATQAEVRGAQAFLRYVGADWHSNYLILAVVAWLHQESGGLKTVIGNNPFNLRPGPDVNALSNGVRKGSSGYFLTFKSIEQGFRAAAARLLKAGNDWRGYGLIIRALRKGGSNADAVDFLNALALSAWDASHYGLPNDNHLLRVYASFTGLKLPPPKQTKEDQPKHHRLPKQPKYLDAPSMRPLHEYLHGSDTRAFYRARHSDT